VVGSVDRPEARERRSGGIPIKAFAGVPWKGKKPKGASGARRAQPTLEREGLLERVKAQKPRPVQPAGVSAPEERQAKRYVGPSRR
jgi:hypothetical protein